MNILRWLALLFGTLLFVYLINHIGPTVIWQEILAIGWWSVGLGLLSLGWYIVYAFAWRAILLQHRKIPLWPLLRIKLIGEMVNTMTPINFVGGDPVRIHFLKRYFPWLHSAASVVIDRTLYGIISAVLVFLGVMVTYWHIPHLPQNMRYGLPTIVLITCCFMAFIFVHQRRGILGFAMNILKKLRIKRHFSERTVDRCRELDTMISSFYREYPLGFWTALAYQAIARAMGIVEIYIIGHLNNSALGWTEAIILGAVAQIINGLFAFIPGALGVMEGAYSGTMLLLGFPPSLGLSIQIIKRLRTAVWTSVGIMLLGKHDRGALWSKDPSAFVDQASQ